MQAESAPSRSKFAGGDQTYLRDVQYADSSNLSARASLHAKYSTAAIPWMTWVRDRIELTADISVLEAGCGPGYLWSEPSGAVPAGVELTLTDLSPGMVDEATERARRDGRYASVAGFSVDLQQLPFDDEQFDRVIANHMLYHLPDPTLGVAQLARVVRPGGRAVASTNGRRHLLELNSFYEGIFDWSPLDHAVDVFGAETGFPILRDHFGHVAWFAYDDTLVCTEQDDVVAYLLSFPPADDATDDQRFALRRAVERRFELEGGRVVIQKDTGCFVCTDPLTN